MTAPVYRQQARRRGQCFVLLSVLLAASLASAWTVQGLVDRQEQGLLTERAAEVNVVLGSLISTTQAHLSLLGTVARVSSESPQTFADVAAVGDRGTVSVAVLRPADNGFVVELAAGTGLTVGQKIMGPRAEAMQRALQVQAVVSTPVMSDGRVQTLGFALGPPSAPPGAVVYQQSVIHPTPSATTPAAAASSPFSELHGALYASPTPDPTQVVLSSAKGPGDGTVLRPFAAGDSKWLLSVSADKPLVGPIAEHLPEIVLAIGMLASLAIFAALAGMARRRDYALALVDDRTAELRESNVSLARAEQEAVEASRLKSLFLANMSHEIRTPLNGVIGMTDLLLASELDTDQRHFALTARRSGEALLDIINDILDFSKIEAGRLDLETSEFDVAEVVEGVAEMLAPLAEQKRLELLTFTAPDVPRVVAGDMSRLRQVLTNLVSNAVKFTDAGEVEVTVTADPEGADLVRFQVRDTGVGIAPADQDRLFESFAQADPSTTRRFGGTGLGLAISKRLVEMMGGTIGVNSGVGRGSTFWFTARLAAHPGTGQGDAPRPLEGCSVLIVDDNAASRTVLDRQLSACGATTIVAHDAASALETLRQAADAGSLPDVAVVDRHMPGMDGLELIRVIGTESRLDDLPIVLLTSPTAQRTVACGRTTACLPKPVRLAALVDVVRRVGRPGPAAAGAGTGGVDRRTTGVPAKASVAGSEAGGPRVLVAEDNLVNQRVAAAMLARLGCRVDVVADGRAAVEALTRAPYAAVLMDCQMPGMNGYEASAEIRRREAPGHHVPIVAVTASAVKGDQERCLAAGMDAYLAKPVTVDALRAVLAGVLPPAGSGPVDPEVLDPDTLATLRELGGDDLFLLDELADLFVDRAPVDLDGLRAAVARGDRAAAAAVAHRLKGSCSAVGAARMAGVASRIELAATDAGGSPVDPGLVVALDRAFDDTRAALRQVSARTPVGG